jgi:hypothetical protein
VLSCKPDFLKEGRAPTSYRLTQSNTEAAQLRQPHHEIMNTSTRQSTATNAADSAFDVHSLRSFPHCKAAPLPAVTGN